MSSNPIPTLPLELVTLIIFYAGLDRPTLCTLCLFNSDIRTLAIRQLYSKLVFRSISAVEACFRGRIREEAWTAEEEKAWKGGGEEKIMGRRARELAYVKELDLNFSTSPQRANEVDGLTVSAAISIAGPFSLDKLRVSRFVDPFHHLDGSILRSLLPLLSPLHLVIDARISIRTLRYLPLSSDRSLILDMYGVPPLDDRHHLMVFPPNSINSNIWYPDGPRVPRRFLLALLLGCSRMCVVFRHGSTGTVRAGVEEWRAEGLFEGKDVRVVRLAEGLRRAETVKMGVGWSDVWHDDVVKGLLDD
jgi:hypothetical protein